MSTGIPNPPNYSNQSEMPPLPPLPPPALYPQTPPKFTSQIDTPAPNSQPKTRKFPFKVVAWIGIPVLLIGGLIGGLEAMALAGKPVRADLHETLDDLSTGIQTGDLLISQADELEPGLQSDLSTQLDDAVAAHSATRNPFVYAPSWVLEDHLETAVQAYDELKSSLDALQAAIDSRDGYFDEIDSAEELIEEGKDLLSKSEAKVTDDSLRTNLAELIDQFRILVDEPVDASSALAFETQRDSIASMMESSIEPAMVGIEQSMQAFDEEEEARKEAEEQAALKDPANYPAISDRDWKLVQRDADSYTGDKFTIYGYVTQADGATGSYVIRADTSGEQFSKWYDYEVNTIIYGVDTDLLKNVVQGDLVELLVEVQGSTTYDTAIGGSATAVMVLAYDVKVTGTGN